MRSSRISSARRSSAVIVMSDGPSAVSLSRGRLGSDQLLSAGVYKTDAARPPASFSTGGVLSTKEKKHGLATLLLRRVCPRLHSRRVRRRHAVDRAGARHRARLGPTVAAGCGAGV